ncbi:MAG: DUF6773 family protein [Lachnospiraceae bacterium]
MMKRIKDERITRETNKVTSKLFFLITALLLLLVTCKLLFLECTAKTLFLEVFCLLLNMLYVVIAKLVKGTLLVKNKDDALKDINRAIYTSAFMIDFWILIFGELVLMLTDKENVLIYALYLPVWMIPSLILTVCSVKSGLLLWGGMGRQQKGKKSLAKSTALGALIYGIIMGFPELFRDGQFQPSGLLWVFGMALGWGVLFYITFRLLVNRGEKQANKQVEKEDDSVEE